MRVSGFHSFLIGAYAGSRKYVARSRFIPFVIVSIFAGLMAYMEYITAAYAITLKIGEPPDWMDALMVIQMITSYCSQLIAWVVCVFVAHLMAVIFDGEGNYADLLFFWGYGYIPLALTAIFLLNVVSPSVGTFAALALSASPQMESVPGVNTVRIFGQLALIMVAAWGTYSVARIHKLTIAKSALCLAIPAISLLLLKHLFKTIG